MNKKFFSAFRLFLSKLREFRLCTYARILLSICLCLHLFYDIAIFICYKAGLFPIGGFKLLLPQIIESQVLALLLTVIGVLLLDCEYKRLDK